MNAAPTGERALGAVQSQCPPTRHCGYGLEPQSIEENRGDLRLDEDNRSDAQGVPPRQAASRVDGHLDRCRLQLGSHAESRHRRHEMSGTKGEVATGWPYELEMTPSWQPQRLSRSVPILLELVRDVIGRRYTEFFRGLLERLDLWVARGV